MKSNIVLIGFMGVGKSTIGKQLAETLTMDFLDTDILIEERMEMTIPEIFNKYGETHFRNLESELIHTLKVKNTILSAGGGMPCFGENLSKLKQIGMTVYLKISPDKLAERLWVVRKKRPLIAGLNSVKELTNFIESKLKLREKFYDQADKVMDINGKASCEILEDLINFVNNLK